MAVLVRLVVAFERILHTREIAKSGCIPDQAGILLRIPVALHLRYRVSPPLTGGAPSFI